MNQGRIWCVVNPTVGLPLFLGSVAVTSLIVHAAVLSHTTWMSSYWQGAAKDKVSLEGAAPTVASADSKTDSAFTMSVSPVSATTDNAKASFVVTVSPNAVTTAGISGAEPIRAASAD